MLSGLCLVSSCFALDDWERAISSALLPVRMSGNLILHLEGTELIQGKYAPVQCDLFLSSQIVDDKPFVQIELTTFLNNKLSDRIVGDGTTLWVYNNRTYEYSAQNYGSYSGKPGPNYQRNLFNAVHGAARGFAAYPARLVKEVFSGVNPEFRSWMPGSPGYTILGGQTYRDPVWPDRVYSPVPTEQVWLFLNGGRRSLALTVDTSTTNTVTSIQFCESFKSGNQPRLSEWTLKVWKDALLDKADFKPYSGVETKGWHAITAPRPSGS